MDKEDAVVDPSRIFAPPPTDEQQETFAEFKKLIVTADRTDEEREFLTDSTLYRYLRARNYNLDKSEKMILATLEWRARVRPQDIRAADIEKETCTGKLRFPGLDRYGRPVLVLDGAAENTWDHEGQMKHLFFHLEKACRCMKNGVEKMTIFIHMSEFSLFQPKKFPAMKTTKETINTLLNHYPERLGTGMFFAAPWAFSGMWSAIAVFLDPVTLQKIQFVRGTDFSADSANGRIMNTIMGPNWEEITGYGKPRQAEGSSPGYYHEEFWPKVLKEEEEYFASLKPAPQQPATPAAAVVEQPPIDETPAAPPAPTPRMAGVVTAAMGSRASREREEKDAEEERSGERRDGKHKRRRRRRSPQREATREQAVVITPAVPTRQTQSAPTRSAAAPAPRAARATHRKRRDKGSSSSSWGSLSDEFFTAES